MSEIKVKERALLVVVNVASDVDKYKWLYEAAEGLAAAVSGVAKPFYGSRTVLKGSSATVAKTVSTLASLGNKSGVKAVDLFLSVHGSKEKLYFGSESIKATDFCKKVKDAGAKNLRAMYSTTCYGAHHAPHFVDIGFDVASGAVGVNTNGATEYPAFVGKWSLGWTYEKALKPDNSEFDEAQDALAVLMGFDKSEVDSTKKIFGDPSQKIGKP